MPAGVRGLLPQLISHKMSSTRRQILLLSSSGCPSFTPYEYAKSDIDDLFQRNKVEELLFVPYAKKDYNDYTRKVKDVFEKWGYNVTGIHTCDDPKSAVRSARAIFIGGGNTFVLLKKLYENNLLELIRTRVNEQGLLYIGCSAGTNVATASIHTTNDMPIVYPPSFDAIGLVPFNINPHYTDVRDSTHHGETRDERIAEFLESPNARTVLGLREGALLKVIDDTAIIGGVTGAVIFEPGKAKKEIAVKENVSHLMMLK